ncbi:MAG: ribonuclease P protein component [Acidimicrobiia bacterium]
MGGPYQSLRGRGEFERLRRSGLRRREGGLTVVMGPGQDGRIRVGLVAGRGVGGAVERNRAKRRLRQALGQVWLKEGNDYIVIATAAVNRVPFADLVGWLQAALGSQE